MLKYLKQINWSSLIGLIIILSVGYFYLKYQETMDIVIRETKESNEKIRQLKLDSAYLYRLDSLNETAPND